MLKYIVRIFNSPNIFQNYSEFNLTLLLSVDVGSKSYFRNWYNLLCVFNVHYFHLDISEINKFILIP